MCVRRHGRSRPLPPPASTTYPYLARVRRWKAQFAGLSPSSSLAWVAVSVPACINASSNASRSGCASARIARASVILCSPSSAGVGRADGPASGAASGGRRAGSRPELSEDMFRNYTLEIVLSKGVARPDFRGPSGLADGARLAGRPQGRHDAAADRPPRPCDDGAMRITGAESTPLFTGTVGNPRQIMRVTVADLPSAGPIVVRAEGPGVTTPQAFRIEDPEAGAGCAAEVPVATAAPHGPGSTLPVRIIAEGPGALAERDAVLTVAEPGWTIWMVSHFHYDPVWWDTQGQFTQTRLLLPGEDGQLPEVRTAFELVKLHLD